MKIVGSSKILDEEDLRNDSVHLNQSGIRKLVEQINSFMKEHNMKEIIRDEHGFLSQRPYHGVRREYTFGCKICSETHTEEQQCPPHNSSQPQESSNSNKGGAEFLTSLKGLDAKKKLSEGKSSNPHILNFLNPSDNNYFSQISCFPSFSVFQDKK